MTDDIQAVQICPSCGREYPLTYEVCPKDGSDLLEYRDDDGGDRNSLVEVTLDGRFHIEEPLGSGGMGKIYRAVQTSVERDVAVKVMREDAASDETKVRRFLREVETLSQLSHPDIVNCIDFGRDTRRDVLYLAMELVEGCDLAEALERGRMRPALTVEIGIRVCSALAEIHSGEVVHRDVKPSNVMLRVQSDGTLRVKLVDFGIAQALERQTRLTQTGVACGTPHYMAPEQVQDRDATAATDLYALGAMLFEMLTGRPLFEADSDLDILIQHLQTPPPDLGGESIGGQVPEPVAGLVDDLLSKSPSDRPESALVVRRILEEIRRECDLAQIRVAPDRSVLEGLDRWIVRESLLSEPTRRVEGAAGAGTVDASPEVSRFGDRVEIEPRGGPAAPDGVSAGREGDAEPWHERINIPVWAAVAVASVIGSAVLAVMLWRQWDDDDVPRTAEESSRSVAEPSEPSSGPPKQSSGPSSHPSGSSETPSDRSGRSIDASDLDGLSDRSAVDLEKVVTSGLELARDEWSDAKLLLLQANNVSPRGRADLTSPNSGSITLVYGSHRAPSDVPDDPSTTTEGGRSRCLRISVLETRVLAHFHSSGQACEKSSLEEVPPTPSCSTEEVWSRAIEQGIPADAVATLIYTPIESNGLSSFWNVTVDGSAKVIRDDCKGETVR